MIVNRGKIMRYIGNKTRLLDKIQQLIKEKNITGEVFCDLFSGTGSVGDYFKSTKTIIANDYLTYASILAKGKLYNKSKPLFENFEKKYNLTPFEYFNGKKYQYENNYFVTNNYSPKGGRQFLTESNSIQIDGIRLELETLYKNQTFNDSEYFYLLASLLESVTKFSNTTGTYEAFLKHWDSRAIKDFVLYELEFNDTNISNNLKNINKVYQKDANTLIREINGDILYIDPPYTSTEYSSAYHLLESIAKYHFPEIKGITGRPVDRQNSNFTRKQSALLAFEDLIRQANFKDIIISYSNQSIIPLNELEDMLKKYAIDKNVTTTKIAYREYKNIRESQKNEVEELYEVLISFKKNIEIIKSPLNYSGSKNDLMDQIIKYIPSNVTTFIDVMGGAFNVGANIVADTVVYNEYNPYVFNLIKYIIETNKEKIIDYTETQIKDFNLKKKDKDTYVNFRNHYNKTKSIQDLFVLTMFCFQNQMRFNNKMEFNTPVGNCAYNENLKNRILNFIPKTSNVELLNKDFSEIDYKNYDKNSLFYFDPPYFITNATYNDGKRGFKGWDEELEKQLLEYIQNISKNGYRFMLSNVIEHKEKINEILKKWVEENGYNVVELNHSTRKEVLITNFDLQKGTR